MRPRLYCWSVGADLRVGLLRLSWWEYPLTSSFRLDGRARTILRLEARAVDPVVVALAGLAAQRGGQQAADDDRDQRDDAASGQRPLVDRDARQVEPLEHVVLRAGRHGQHGERDGDQQAEDPDADALARAVEARHAA